MHFYERFLVGLLFPLLVKFVTAKQALSVYKIWRKQCEETF